ncbi:hypothetical protein [Pseudomonas sp. L13]|uniref:hypothetical protein n=1 Tax=Pseudomonas sp. L13 TaxID=343985 RepID=UPI001379772C|nr:hypothetical protein [Pseudomonas sp. L13]NCE90365.1 hypothetical protein [Pseudomonas sp. L13]
MSESTVSVPIATNVTIIGENMPGGTIRGSYKYSATGGEFEEGRSLCRWYVGEHPGPHTEDFDLPIMQGMIGEEVRFAVTPVSASGVIGHEVYSQVKTIVSGYQNISEEESNSSFIKQYGAFSLYRNEPNDRIVNSTSGAFAWMSGSTQSVFVKGRADSGGTPPVEIEQYLKNNPATRMFSTARDFAALVPVVGSANQLLLWGQNIGPIPHDLDLSNIKYVYCNEAAIVWIYDNPPLGKNRIGAFGSVAHGGAVPDEIQRLLLHDQPVAIYSTAAAFAVRTEAGAVFAWGSPAAGGTFDQAKRKELDAIKTTRIVCSAGAFCAIGPTRAGSSDADTVVSWGPANSGGAMSSKNIADIRSNGGANHVVANRDSFVVITHESAIATSWGGPYGGVMNKDAEDLAARGDIVMCAGTPYAFCMVNRGGRIAAWGVNGMGGNTPTSEGDGALEETFTVVDAGEVLEASDVKERVRALFEKLQVNSVDEDPSGTSGIECACRSVGKKRSSLTHFVTQMGEVTLSTNDASFFMSSKGSGGITTELITWGHAGYGGQIPSPTRQVLMASQITDVYCTNGAYAMITNQGGVTGAVVAFGATNAQQEAGQIPVMLQPHLRTEIKELYSIQQMPPYNPNVGRQGAFSARVGNGTWVTWGAPLLVPNEHFDPTKP